MQEYSDNIQQHRGKKTIGVGVIGMGWMGMAHSRAYTQIVHRFYESDFRPRMVICADDVPARAAQAQETIGFEETTTNWLDVINHPEVDVVNVTAPNFLHLEMVKAAVAAGKHVFCEKPVGRSTAETLEIEHITRQAGLLSFVGFNYRWTPMVQHALELIKEGRLGKLTHYRGRFFSMYGSNPYGLLTWRFEQDKAGTGVLGDIMSHVVDMAHMLVGDIDQISSHRHTFITERPLPIPGEGTHFSVGKPGDPTGPVTNEDYVSALVQFSNGVQGTFETCRAIYGPKCEMAFEVNGTEGALSWNFERMNELKLYLPGQAGDTDGYTTIYGGPKYSFHGRFNPGDGVGMGYEDLKTLEAYHFLKSVADSQQIAPSFADAARLAKVQDAMMRSWESGSWESIDYQLED